MISGNHVVYLWLLMAILTHDSYSLVVRSRSLNRPPLAGNLGALRNDRDDNIVSMQKKRAKSLLAAGMMALTLNTGDVQAAGTNLAALESSITSLESASNRAETIQGLADVFEASGSKTLLVRTKYKARIINAINKKHVDLNNEWDSVLGYESGELKRRVDPFRTVDLKEYLRIAPYVGGVCYLGALFIQQAVPELFVFAYPAAVLVFALPIAFTILTT